jgi:DNA polymerase III delta subunit
LILLSDAHSIWVRLVVSPATVALVKPLVTIAGPRDAGPGERQLMMERAGVVFAQFDITDPVRIDVPGRGADSVEDSSLRHGLEPLVPALQSGSLFGDRSGVLIADAQNFLKGEAELVSELISHLADDSVVVVFASLGAIPAPLGKTLKPLAESITVAKLRERDAGEWLAAAARSRGIKVHSDGAAALLQHFGSDTAALGQALDQLAAAGEEATADSVTVRFRGRPDEPMWHYADAVSSGDVAMALRRLADFLAHGHPLQLLAFMEGEVRRRSLAAAAPDIATYAEWAGGTPDSYPVQKAWRRRSEAHESDIARALDALSRADLLLKTAPEATHRITLERLTVALCRWVGRARRAS